MSTPHLDTALTAYARALTELAERQDQSDNPITKAWATVHRAHRAWVGAITDEVRQLQQQLAPKPDPAQARLRLQGAPVGLLRALRDLIDSHGYSGVVGTLQDMGAVPEGEWADLIEPAPEQHAGGTATSAPTAGERRLDFGSVEPPLRNLTVTPIVHEVTDTHVVVRFYITAPGWQRVRVWLGPGVENEVDITDRADPLIIGEHRFPRPAVSREQEIVVTGLSDGADSAVYRTTLWLPQVETDGEVRDTLDVEAMEPPPDEG